MFRLTMTEKEINEVFQALDMLLKLGGLTSLNTVVGIHAILSKVEKIEEEVLPQQGEKSNG